VRFKDLELWSVNSFHKTGWMWSPENIKPLSAALTRRRDEVDKREHAFETLQLATIRFDGTIEPRELHGKQEFKGALFFAHPGNVVYSKIDVRHGAIGIVSDEMPRLAVSNEFPVYEVRAEVATPRYIKLLFRTAEFRQAINGMISGTSGRKRVQPEQLERLEVPLPPLDTQRAIVARWQAAQDRVKAAKESVRRVTEDINDALHQQYRSGGRRDVLKSRWLAVMWRDLPRWDVMTSRAAAFRLENPSFEPLGKYVEEATELVKPWVQPQKEWAVYGVNNKEGVVFSHYQKGEDFNAPYKRIRKGWFFHNPTRSSVGSLGIVPDVPEDALTSPEYQVWRIREAQKDALLSEYVAVLINTPFFINLIQFHRVGAVKQRLYVENLMEIHIPVFPAEQQLQLVAARADALQSVVDALSSAKEVDAEIEALILGTESLAAAS
jgi:type I restriction enzyme S subunit